MANNESSHIADRELEKALADLLAQIENEPISSRFRELATRLEAALEEARLRRDDLAR